MSVCGWWVGTGIARSLEYPLRLLSCRRSSACVPHKVHRLCAARNNLLPQNVHNHSNTTLLV